MTNKEFAEKVQIFKKACELAGIKPSTRQASKWNRSKGVAYKLRNEAAIAMCKEA